MRTVLYLLVVFSLCVSGVCLAEGGQTIARRNIEWSLLTLSKIEKDLRDLCSSEKVPVPALLTAEFKKLRGKVSGLKDVSAGSSAEKRRAGATHAARLLAGAVTLVSERVELIEALKKDHAECVREDKRLAGEEMAASLSETVKKLVRSVAAEVVSLLNDKKAEASLAAMDAQIAVAHYEWRLAAAREALEMSDMRAELVQEMTEAGLVPDMDRFNLLIEKRRALQRKRHELSMTVMQIDKQREVFEMKLEAVYEAEGKLDETEDGLMAEFDELVEGIWAEIEKAAEDEEEFDEGGDEEEEEDD